MQRLIYILLFTLLCQASWSQTTDKQRNLELRKEQILKEIKNVQKMLLTEKSKERNVLAEIAEQNKKIRLSQELIQNTQQQLRLLTDNIYKNQLQINKLQKELGILKADYAKMIAKSYKSRSEQSRMMFILSSKNFLQAYKRIQYMKQYASFRKNQGEEVKVKSTEVQAIVATLESQKSKQRLLLNDAEKEKKELEKDRIKQEELVALIKKDQKKYNDQIKKKQEETRAIDRQIQKLIREAIAEANRKAREAAAKAAAKAGKKTPTAPAKSNTTTFELTPEGKIIANNFKANQGSLPWPVAKGYISLPYGDQPHPVQSQLTIHNSGLEISTEPGSSARAVFGGEVLQVQVLSGGNKAVLIQHGDYITVYQNLSSVSVKKGDKVSIKENIGTISTNATGRAVLKFLLSHNTTIHNPQSWLSRSN
ncbi:murein hydrolase activator EnvC [Flavobacterium sp. NKUCC04_CG]|uniref:murein hydrolase activator EnvC family protein n=1 Tax=Flavobacterium sp. NKUCC04_CG TaxID=2842121 RepID=UPI001C5AF5E0|nr:peptidoglycan DD-metalloendopeptidase family protein [Flavobacterium sp. NKUCC04_CG]MBW3520181.1 peptidoglycan DD-metalloendopeptidase family protein [Flavobacterium sp. NKUCC04_CG]